MPKIARSAFYWTVRVPLALVVCLVAAMFQGIGECACGAADLLREIGMGIAGVE